MATDNDELKSVLAVSPDVVLDGLRDLVSTTSPDNDATALLAQAGVLFTRLRLLNRSANAATRARKQATTEVRHEMDQTHLDLQNLLYEKRHLEREIEKCRQFATVYQDIPLCTTAEFLERAPEEMRTEEIVQDEHALMLSRLNFELTERQRLAQTHKECLQKKEELLKLSKAKVSTMDSVKVQMDHLMKTATDVQKKVTDLVQTSVQIPATTSG